MGTFEFVEGKLAGDAPGPGGYHLEACAINYLGDAANSARQASTHYACESCEVRQAAARVINVTGFKSQQGQLTRLIGGY